MSNQKHYHLNQFVKSILILILLNSTSCLSIRTNKTYNSKYPQGMVVCQRFIHSDADDDLDKYPTGLLLYNLETKDETLLTLENEYSPKWSPDGSKIVFVSGEGRGDIYLMNRDGSSVEQLTEDPNIDFLPNWSPNGQMIIFSSERNGNLELYTIDIDTKKVKRLTFSDNNGEVDAVYSPDGSQIAFASYFERGSMNIYVMDADGTNIQQITKDHTGDYYRPTWCPNGTCLIYETDIGLTYEEYRRLIVYDFETQTEEFLLSGYYENQENTHEWFASLIPNTNLILLWLLNDEINSLYTFDIENQELFRLDISGGQCSLYP